MPQFSEEYDFKTGKVTKIKTGLTVKELQDERIELIKQQCAQQIMEQVPVYKQINAIHDKLNAILDALKLSIEEPEALQQLAALRERSQNKEEKILKAKKAEAIDVISWEAD